MTSLEGMQICTVLTEFCCLHLSLMFMLLSKKAGIASLATKNQLWNIPNSIKVAFNWQLFIGNWALGIWAYEHNATLCLSDHQTIASHAQLPMPKGTFIELGIHYHSI